jgi:Fur family ferric uptake transcriptional regulator
MTATERAPAMRTDWSGHAEAALRDAGHRSSGPRMAIVDMLGRHGCLLTAREIADRLRAEGRDIGVATVYRSLEVLEGLGLLHRVEREGVSLYEPAHPSGEHHHHLICDRCGRVSAFEDAGLERSIQRMARRLAFRVEGHDVALRGTCAACLVGQGHAAAG